jgi:hypothetical protein
MNGKLNIPRKNDNVASLCTALLVVMTPSPIYDPNGGQRDIGNQLSKVSVKGWNLPTLSIICPSQ